MFEYIDRIVCLAIDKRQEEWPRIAEMISTRGGKAEFFICGNGQTGSNFGYNQIDPPDSAVPSHFSGPKNSYKAFLAFTKILHSAYAAGIERLLLLEDDCIFTADFDKVFTNARADIRRLNLQPDFLYYGANHALGAKTIEITRNLLRVYGSYCFHAVELSRNAIGRLLDYPPTAPIDLIASWTHPDLKAYALWPNVALQKPGMSYVEGRERDYSEFWNSKGNVIT